MSTLFVTIAKPGHGKSYVAEQISDICGARHLESDFIRKNEVADGEPTYSSDESKKTYELLFKKAEDFLSSGRHVVLDATFNKQIGRNRAEKISNETSSKVVFLRIKCDEDIAKNRIEDRNGVSDADIEVYENFIIEPIEDREIVTIDNSGTFERTRQQVESIVQNSI